MFYAFLLLSVLFATPSCAKLITTDYCDPNICSNGLVHIGCNNDGALGRKCAPTAKVHVINSGTICKILHLHNHIRNNVASGKVGYFAPATRMAKMRWLPELAELASLQVRQCHKSTDACRNLDILPYVGQVGGFTSLYGKEETVESIILKTMERWCHGAETGDYRNLIESFQSPHYTKNFSYFHLTQVLQEDSTHIGCAVLHQTKGRSLEQYFVCNYAKSNLPNKPVYETGLTASGCLTGRDHTYNNLCSVRELYNWGNWKNVELVWEPNL